MWELWMLCLIIVNPPPLVVVEANDGTISVASAFAAHQQGNTKLFFCVVTISLPQCAMKITIIYKQSMGGGVWLVGCVCGEELK